ncbi:hypothetical protein SynROS8604_01513 [Synechococcus sp. ROS8604]|nr:hypothetical protein SynROS8604_01513 [Synechococcus sp. ROS8604]
MRWLWFVVAESDSYLCCLAEDQRDASVLNRTLFNLCAGYGEGLPCLFDLIL